MIQVADNFNYRGKKPNFDRDSFDTLQDMKNYSENSLDDGHIFYCKETDKHYKFNSNNQSDPTTGKWVEQHEAVPADEEDITEQKGNYFDGSYDKLDTNYGIYATKQSGKNIITGNSFWHLKKEAIHIEGLFDSTIANNNFDDNDIYGRGLPDIYLGVSSYSNVIIGNTFNRQMIFDPSDNYVVKNRKDAGTLAPIFNISSTISNGTTLITGNTLINPQLYLPAVYTNNPNLIVSKGNNHSIFENKSSDPTLNYMQCGDIKATQNAPIIKNTLGEFNRLQIVKTSQQKKQSEALNHYTFDGTSVFDTDNIKPTWVYKETWYDSNGNPAYAEKTGTQYQRPANVKMGFYYFDTSLNKPIWKNSDTENVWIDATGATV